MFTFMKVEVLRLIAVFFVCLMENGMITADQVAGAINDPEFYHNPLY
jgi:hypothetical protein